MRRIKAKYLKRLECYLMWRTGNLFRQTFDFDPNGVTAAEAMCAWESEGTPLPSATSEPELLADFVQGKKSRDWHITEWRLAVKQGLFKPEEFAGCLGLDEKEFQSAFAGLL